MATSPAKDPYASLATLLDLGASSVLVVRDMAGCAFARELIEVLCQRGTLTDALLELHRLTGCYRDVTVCGSDLRLRLRSGEGKPAPALHAAATAKAWIQLGVRLRGVLGDAQVRIVALSGHVVQAAVSDVRHDRATEFRLSGVKDTDVKEQVRRDCSDLANRLGQSISGQLTVVGADVPGLDSGQAVVQACKAAVLKALTGSFRCLTRQQLLLVPGDLAERSDGVLLPSASPVVV